MSTYIAWIFDPANSTEIGGWGFLIGFVGLMLTMLGFGITFAQLARTKSASQAVRDEVQRIRTSLTRYDAIQESARASSLIGMSRKLLKTDQWSDILDNYEDFRRSLITIRNNVPALSEDQLEKIENASSYIERLCGRIDRGLHKNSIGIDRAKTLTVMRQHSELVFEIQQVIHRSMVDEHKR